MRPDQLSGIRSIREPHAQVPQQPPSQICGFHNCPPGTPQSIPCLGTNHPLPFCLGSSGRAESWCLDQGRRALFLRPWELFPLLNISGEPWNPLPLKLPPPHTHTAPSWEKRREGRKRVNKRIGSSSELGSAQLGIAMRLLAANRTPQVLMQIHSS